MSPSDSLPMTLRFGLALLHIPHAVAAPPEKPMQTAVASWYNDAGQTACGFHDPLGFASLILRCGTRVLFRGPSGREAIGVMQDHGPYIAGRTFDLSPGLKATLACPDLCTVRWRAVL